MLDPENPFTPISLGARKMAPTESLGRGREAASAPLLRKVATQPPPPSRRVSGIPRGRYSGKTCMFHVTNEMCRGEILRQAGSKLCVEMDCEVEAHQQTRLPVPDQGAIFLKVPGRTRSNQVFTCPMVPVDKPPPGMSIQTLERDAQEVDALRAFMNTLIGEDGGTRTTEDEWDDASSLLTPNRLRAEIGHSTSFHTSTTSEGPRETSFQRVARKIMTPAKMGSTFPSEHPLYEPQDFASVAVDALLAGLSSASTADARLCLGRCGCPLGRTILSLNGRRRRPTLRIVAASGLGHQGPGNRGLQTGEPP